MYRRNNAGGWNRSHGTVEEMPRIDSYEAWAGECEYLFCRADKGCSLVLDCFRYMKRGPETYQEIVKVCHPKDGWSREIELSRKRNGYGGDQAFFLCPACGRRVRYLYQVGATFLCRKCSILNYKSQQETRSGAQYYYNKGVALVDKHLDTWPRVRPDGFTFGDWIPERPRYVHQSTYRRYLRRLAKYQDQHQRRQMEDMAKILKIFK